MVTCDDVHGKPETRNPTNVPGKWGIQNTKDHCELRSEEARGANVSDKYLVLGILHSEASAKR